MGLVGSILKIMLANQNISKIMLYLYEYVLCEIWDILLDDTKKAASVICLQRRQSVTGN